MLKIVAKSKITHAIDRELARAGIKKMINEFFKTFPKGEIFVVGGAVRDILMNRDKVGDLDIVARNVKANDLKKFLNQYGKVSLVGKTFGVFKFKPKEGKQNNFVDFALPRTEHALGTGGYRDFDVQSDPELPLREDLKRRDFTINSLAWCIKRKKLIDEFGGLNDLRAGIIRTVGKPKERFSEDYSRILRAIRFATELDFEIESQTWQAVKKMMRDINKKKNGKFIVPRETIAKEFLKSFYADPLTAFGWWDSSTAFGYLIPEISELKRCKQPKEFHSEGNAWKHIELALDILRSDKFKKEFGDDKPSLYTALGVLFHDIAKPKTIKPKSKKRAHIGFPGHAATGAKMTREIIKRLKLESYKNIGIDIETKKLCWLVGEHMTILANDPKNARHTQIEKYFLQKDFPKNYLLQICYCDIHGSITGTDLVNLYKIHYLAYKNRIGRLEARFPKGLPRPILDGNEIMKILKIKPGPKVAEIMDMLREAQLAGNIKNTKEAEDFIKN
jgi:tRNA nucleotidyltransferase/poly(A) polymerase